MRKALLLICCFVFIFSTVWSQQRNISGRVLDATSSQPIIGATIATAEGNAGTITNGDGKFTLQVSPETKAVRVSYVGFVTQTIPLTAESNYNILLQTDENSLKQVVVVGYGTQKRADVTGAVSTVDVEKTLGSKPITDVARGLQGAVPGLTITTASGDIGTDPKIRLRGLTGSLNTGPAGAKPLILVDNVEVQSLQMINPEDIQSISVLKDAASTSIYGTRAAWGVILVTTKSGKKNSPVRITYSDNFAWSTPTTTPQLMSGADNATASLLAMQRSNPNTQSYSIIGMSVDQASIQKMREWDQKYGGQDLGDEMVKGRDFDIIGGKLYFYRSWQAGDRYMKKWAPQQKHNISLDGGSSSTSYHLGLGYLGQTGVLKVNPDRFNRYNATLSVNSTVNKWLDVKGQILYSNSLTTSPFEFASSQYGPWYYLYRWPATYPYGTYEGKPFRSAVTEVAQAKMNHDKNSLTRVSLGGTIHIIPGLTIDADYTYSALNEHIHKTGGEVNAYNFWSFNGTALDYTSYQSASYNRTSFDSYWNAINTGKLYATYNKQIQDHSFKIIAGGDLELYQETSQYSERRDLLDPNFGEIPLATGDQFVDGSDGHWSTLGFFGRINYAFKDKYLLELNGRFDGSSRFPVNDLWGFFPSMSAGYVISKESFMNSIKPVLSFLKIRGSYGSIGNQDVGNNRFLSVMSSNNSGWIIGGNNLLTLSTPGALSPALSWETVKTLDLGIDARFFNDQLGLTFDWYNRTTSDMITQGATLPNSFGTASPVRNFGELQGKGWELAIDYNHSFNNGLHFSITASLSDGTEKITKFSDVTKTIPDPIMGLNAIYGRYYQGMTLGEIWGFQTDRLFNENDFDGTDDNGHYIYKKGIPSQSQLESGFFYFGPGDVKYKDTNGDGVITYGSNTVDDPGDQKIIGNSTPRYQYGFMINADWKSFDLSLFIQGVGKRELWADGPIIFPGERAAEGWYIQQTDYWTPDNPDAFYPRPTDYGAAIKKWNFWPQTRYMLNMAYTRLKNLTIGYTLSDHLIKSAHIHNLRIYLSGENLFEIDHLGGIPIDPEIDFRQDQIDHDRIGFGRNYPYRRTISVGLQATF